MYAVLLTLLSVSFMVGANNLNRNKIPNGFSVPHPCHTSIWQAVGHLDTLHGNPNNLNYFGASFRLYGYTWNQQLCREDSDLDGKTNGEELGDPNCVWVAGATPEQPATSHPGINEKNFPCF